MTSDNRFERIRDTLQSRLEKRKALAYEAFGVGQRPYGTVQLSKAQMRAWWGSLTPAEKAQKYAQMTPQDRNELLKAHLAGLSADSTISAQPSNTEAYQP